MTRFALIVLVACGGSKPAPISGSGSAEPVGVAKDTRTPIQRRQDDACTDVGKKLTDCALSDAKAAFAAKQISKGEFDAATEPAVLEKHTQKYVEGCTEKPLSSRQVRVLEVCFREEPECGPLEDCLKNLQPEPAK
jgi:hypothetical protein